MQTFIVILIIGIALAWLARRIFRTLNAPSSCGCEGQCKECPTPQTSPHGQKTESGERQGSMLNMKR